MKKLVLIIILIYTSKVTFSQKEDRIWVFSDSIGIDFNNLVNPNLINTNCHYSWENFASISDTGGQLRFYLNGYPTIAGAENFYFLRLCDSTGNTMLNGDTIYTNLTESQGAVIVSFPDNNGKYFIIYKQHIQAGNIGLPFGLFYSIIDMNQNGGLGKVIQKNQSLIFNRGLCEKVAAVRHANGRDWWVFTHGINDNRYYEFLVDPTGIHGPFIQDIGTYCDTLNYASIAGQMKFSSDGSKMVFVNLNATIDLYDFDRCSGLLSNWQFLGDTDNLSQNLSYGCEFSPDGNVLYVSTADGGVTDDYLYQYDLTAANIAASRITLWTRTNCTCDLGQMKLGPDGKIYFTNAFCAGQDTLGRYLNVINNPDNVGISCNVGQYQFSLGNHAAVAGLPNIPNYNLGALTGSACDTLTGIKELTVDNLQLTVYPNPVENILNVRSEKLKVNTITVSDLIGRKVLVMENINSFEIALDVSALQQGIYFIEVKTKDGVAVRKFVEE